MAYTPEQQASNAAAVKPVLWARLSVNHTKKTCFFSCLVPLVALAIVIASGVFEIDNPGSRDYLIRSDIRTRQRDAREAARDEYPYDDGEQTGDIAERSDFAGDKRITILLRGRVGEDGKVGVYDKTAEDAFNILTLEGIKLLKKAEDRVYDDPKFKAFCLSDPDQKDCDGKELDCALPESILKSKHLYGEYDGDRFCARRPSSHNPTEEDFNNFLNEEVFDEDGNVKLEYVPYMGKDFNRNNKETWTIQSIIDVGEPFKGYSSTEDREDDQDEEYLDWGKDVQDDVEDMTTSRIDAYAISSDLVDGSFGDIVLRDLSFSVIAIILVFILIWIHTTSMYLAGTAMAQIFLAFPFAFVLYWFVFQQKYFSALQILVIFVLLGIGADDVFVFTDAWKQASVVLGSDCDLITRMSWTYRRSVRAMAVTSMTTAAAFFVNAASPIMPIGTLGVWAGLLVLFVFVLVITMYPCAIVTWHRFWRVRMFTNCFRAPQPGMENVTPPSIWSRCMPAKWRREKEEGVDEYRSMERFFRGPWLGFVRRGRYVLVVLAAALAGVCIYLATRLEPPEETEQFLPDSDPILVAFTTLEDAYPRSDADYQLRVRVTWGVDDIDRDGTTKFDTEKLGKVVLDNKFQLRTAEAQAHVEKACDFFNSGDLIFPGNTIKDKVECWIRDFKDWRGGSFKDYNDDKEFIEELKDFGSDVGSDGRSYERYLREQHIAFTEDRIVFTEIRFVSPLEAAEPYKVMWPVYNDWQDKLEELNNQAPEGVKDAIATGGYAWTYQITQRRLVRSMFTGIGIMLGVSVVTLTVSTLNWAVAILATLCIGGIVAMLLGLIYLYGWQLGITESIGVVIAIGYSFDGAAHIATAYVESKNMDRLNRAKDALTDLGISITFGAISTVLAGIALLPATIIFFTKFAGLMLTTVILGLIWSLMILPSLLLIVGPVGDFASLKPFVAKVQKCFRRNSSTTGGETVPETKTVDGESLSEGPLRMGRGTTAAPNDTADDSA